MIVCVICMCESKRVCHCTLRHQAIVRVWRIRLRSLGLKGRRFYPLSSLTNPSGFRKSMRERATYRNIGNLYHRRETSSGRGRAPHA